MKHMCVYALALFLTTVATSECYVLASEPGKDNLEEDLLFSDSGEYKKDNDSTEGGDKPKLFSGVKSFFNERLGAVKHKQQGNKYLKSKDYAQAIFEYEAALSINPKLANNPKFMGRLNTAQTELLFHDGMKWKKIGNWQEAITSFEKVLVKNPYHSGAKKELSNVYYERGVESRNIDSNKAITDQKKAIEIDPNNVKARETLAELINGRIVNEKKSKEMYDQGVVSIEKHDLEKAIEYFRQAVQLNRKNNLAEQKLDEVLRIWEPAQRYYETGCGYLKTCKLDEAISAFHAALNNYMYYEEAKERLEEANSQKEKATSSFKQGMDLFRKKQWDNATLAFKETLSINSEHSQVSAMLSKLPEEAARHHHSVGLTSLKNNKLERASDEFTLALQYIPDFEPAKEGLAEISYKQALSYLDKHDLKKAIEHFRIVVQLNKNNHLAREKIDEALGVWEPAQQHYETGCGFLKTCQLDKAVSEFQEVLNTYEYHKEAKASLEEANSQKEKAISSYKHGMGFFKKKQWDKAAQAFKDALSINSEHSRASAMLSGLPGEAARYHQSRGLKFLRKNKLEMASTEFDLALQYIPDFKTAKEGLAEIPYKRALSYLDKHDLKNAIEYFRIAVQLNKENNLAKKKLDVAIGVWEPAQQHYETGCGFLKACQLDKAVSEFQEALNKYSYHKEAKASLEEANSQKEKAIRTHKQGMDFFERKQWDNATQAFKEALSINSEHSQASAMLSNLPEEAARYHQGIGLTLLSDNEFDRASAEFTSALQFIPDFEPAKVALAETSYKRAIEFQSHGKFANALIELGNISSIQPHYKDTNEMLYELERNIIQRIKCNVALLKFENPTSAGGISDRVMDGVYGNIVKANVRGVEFIERSEMRKILNEQELGMSGIVDQNTAIPVGKIKGVDIIISGKILEYVVKTTKHEEPKMLKYKSGTRSVLNTKYQEAQNEYEIAINNESQARRVLQQAEARNERQQAQNSQTTMSGGNRYLGLASSLLSTTSVIAEKNAYSKAQSLRQEAADRLSSTPSMIEVPVEGIWNYNVVHTERIAILDVSFRVLDTLTGKVIAANTVSEKIIKKDKSIDRPNTLAGVYENPLELPSEFEMQGEITRKVIKRIAYEITSNIRDYGTRHLVLAKKAEKKGDSVGAIEEYMNYLYAAPDRKDYEISKAKEYLKKQKGYEWRKMK